MEIKTQNSSSLRRLDYLIVMLCAISIFIIAAFFTGVWDKAISAQNNDTDEINPVS